jgi:replication factor C subunit 2/4
MATLFAEAQAAQAGLAFPQSLSEKYRPRKIGEFAGLEKPKKILSKFAGQPYPSAWLFVGPPGTGKTTMGLALASELRGEVHHVPSQKCTVEAVEDVVRRCWYVPMNNTFHVVLVDEADRMTPAAQLALLSKLDSTAYPPATVFVFTCNSTEGLEPRFLSRCRVLEFSSYGMSQGIVSLLESVWNTETCGAENSPNFARIAKDALNNVRDALMKLELEIMAA